MEFEIVTNRILSNPKVATSRLSQVDEMKCHVAENPWDCLEKWQDVAVGLDTKFEPEVFSVGPCRLQYEWMMRQFRFSESNGRGYATSPFLELLPRETLDLMGKLKKEEDDLRDSYLT